MEIKQAAVINIVLKTMMMVRRWLRRMAFAAYSAGVKTTVCDSDDMTVALGSDATNAFADGSGCVVGL